VVDKIISYPFALVEGFQEKKGRVYAFDRGKGEYIGELNEHWKALAD
jgi:hypothetical protein